MLRNINKSKETENELRKINLILRETGKLAKVGGWEFDAESGEGTWTDEVARIHEVDPAEPTSVEKGISFYKDQSREKIEKALNDLIQNGTPYDLELILHTKPGNKKWIRTIGHPVYKGQKITRVIGSFQDITDHKEAEMEIKKYREHLEELVKERTAELEESNAQLERMNNLFVGREFRIKELKTQIEHLKKELNDYSRKP